MECLYGYFEIDRVAWRCRLDDVCLKYALNLQDRPDLSSLLGDDGEANLIIVEFAPRDLANRTQGSTEL